MNEWKIFGMEKQYTMRFDRGGMFYIINNVLDMLSIAEKEHFKFNLKLDDCLYQQQGKIGHVWNYYFEDLFEIDQFESFPLYNYKQFRKDHLLAPRFRNNRMDPLLLPKNRLVANNFIVKYIRLKPHIQTKITDFIDKNQITNSLGLHIRGPGRVHGGMQYILDKLVLTEGVPFQIYFKFVDEFLEQDKKARIFLCSDSGFVIEECKKHYGDRVFTYDSLRSEYGELHEEGDSKNIDLSRYKLGEDIIIEAYLLSKTKFFIHGNSNISNFVLCKNPSLKHKYVFSDVKTNWHLIHFKKDLVKVKDLIFPNNC